MEMIIISSATYYSWIFNEIFILISPFYVLIRVSWWYKLIYFCLRGFSSLIFFLLNDIKYHLQHEFKWCSWLKWIEINFNAAYYADESCKIIYYITLSGQSDGTLIEKDFRNTVLRFFFVFSMLQACKVIYFLYSVKKVIQHLWKTFSFCLCGGRSFIWFYINP